MTKQQQRNLSLKKTFPRKWLVINHWHLTLDGLSRGKKKQFVNVVGSQYHWSFKSVFIIKSSEAVIRKFQKFFWTSTYQQEK